MHYCFNVFLSILCFSNTLFSQEITKCDENKKFIIHEQSIDQEKVGIIDKLLENYEDEYQELTDLLKKLSDNSLTTAEKINEFEKLNQMLNEKNNDLASEIDLLLEEMDYLDNEIDLQKQEQKENTVPVKIEDVEIISNGLNEWTELAKKLDIDKTNDVMNLAHSISHDISFLEQSISDENDDPTCIENLEEELKRTFKELSELLEFDELLRETKELEKLSNNNKERANQLLKLAEEVMEEEKSRAETQKLANETLDLAKDLENLKATIDQQSPKTNFVKTGLEELKDLLDELETYEDKEKFDLATVSEDIELYINDMDCLQKYINNCKPKLKSVDKEETPACIKKYLQ